MLVYILKSIACLAILFVFYKIFLEKENMHVFKRFYLLGALLFSMIIPSLVFTEYVMVEPEPMVTLSTPVIMQQAEYSNDVVHVPQALETDVIDIAPILWGVYFIGLFFFGLKFIRNLFQIYRRIRKNPKQKLSRFTQVLLQEKITPHTFFSYIFLNKKKFEADQIPAEVLLHEQTHASQKHSWDVILVELLHVIFWINPFIYLTKKAIKLNHEFLADQAVLKENIDKTTYQNTLLSYLSPDSEKKYQPLANAINYSSIKKRFTVMKTRTSKKAVLLRSLLLLPLLAILVYGFSETAIVQVEPKEYYDSDIPKSSPQITKNLEEELKKINSSTWFYYVPFEGATEKMMQEYEQFIADYEKTKTVRYDSYQRIVAIYDLMTNEQKESVKKYPEPPVINDINVTEVKSLSTSKFEAYKNRANYAIWLNGKVIENKLLNDFELSDIVYHNESFVYKNARSKKFPQEYQVSLYTEKGFEENFIKSKVDDYNKLAENYIDNITVFLKSDQSDNSELRIQKAQLDQLYKNISVSERKKYNAKQLPEVPNRKIPFSQKASEKSFKSSSKSDSLKFIKGGATREELRTYNVLANKYNVVSIEKRIIPKEDLKIIETVFRKMTNDQKSENQPFPECLPKNAQDGATKEQIDEYNKLAKGHNLWLDNSVIPRKSEVRKVIHLYSLMTQEQKKSVEIFPEYPKILEGATKQQIAEYNALAKKYNTMLKKSSSIQIKMKDVQRLEYIYGLMSKKQKAAAEPFPDFPEMPPVPDAPKAPNEREEAANIIEKIIEEQDPNDNVHANFYSPIKKKNAPRVLKGELSDIPEPPTPPEPVSPLDHVIDMAKKNAIFYLEGKEITSDKAIEIMKKNKDMNIDSRSANGKRPVVKMSTKPIKIGHVKRKVKDSFQFNSQIEDPNRPREIYAKQIIDKNNEEAIFYHKGKKIDFYKALDIVYSKRSLSLATFTPKNSSKPIVILDRNFKKYNFKELMNSM